MGAGEEWLAIYHAAGLHYLYLGDEAIVDCQTFSLAGHKMKGLRQACTRLVRHGYTVEFLDPAKIEPGRVTDDRRARSRCCAEAEAERGFSMMLGRLFDPKDKRTALDRRLRTGRPDRWRSVSSFRRPRSRATRSTSCAVTRASTPTA